MRQILAKNVLRLMDETGIDTQPALATKAKVGQSHISRIVNGRQSVGIDVVEAVSAALGCQPWELLIDNEETRRAAYERILRVRDLPDTSFIPPPALRAVDASKRLAYKRRKK